MIARFYNWFYSIFLKLLILIESIIGVRIIVKFLKANPETPAVKYLYKITDKILFPFKDIFPNLDLKKLGVGISAPVDIVAITSGVGYLLLFLLIIGIFKLIVRE